MRCQLKAVLDSIQELSPDELSELLGRISSSAQGLPRRARKPEMKSENKTLLTPEETSAFLGVSVETLAQWRSQRRGPHFTKVGRLVRYRLSDL